MSDNDDPTIDPSILEEIVKLPKIDGVREDLRIIGTVELGFVKPIGEIGIFYLAGRGTESKGERKGEPILYANRHRDGDNLDSYKRAFVNDIVHFEINPYSDI